MGYICFGVHDSGALEGYRAECQSAGTRSPIPVHPQVTGLGLRVFTQGVSTCCKCTLLLSGFGMLKVLVCVVPKLFPPERQVTQLCVKLSVMYMDMRRADINDDEMDSSEKKRYCFQGSSPIYLGSCSG